MRKSLNVSAIVLSLVLAASAVPTYAATRQNDTQPRARQEQRETSVRRVLNTILRRFGVNIEPTIPMPKDQNLK